MYGVIHGITLVILWGCIALNWWSIWRLTRTRRELENQVRIWRARNKYEEESDEGDDND